MIHTDEIFDLKQQLCVPELMQHRPNIILPVLFLDLAVGKCLFLNSCDIHWHHSNKAWMRKGGMGTNLRQNDLNLK